MRYYCITKMVETKKVGIVTCNGIGGSNNVASGMAGQRELMQELIQSMLPIVYVNRVRDRICVLADLKKIYLPAYDICTRRAS